MFSSNTSQVASAGGYEIQRSLRFNSADGAYLNRTPASAGNRKTWTWSGWVKLGQLNINQYGLFSARSGVDSTRFTFGLWTGNTILISDISSANVGIMDFETAQVFRDPSAWYHIVMAVDTTQATNTNRLKLYVNGVQIFFSIANYPSQNADTGINAVIEHNTGKYALTGNFVDGYLTEVNFIDGQALTPSSFGAFDAQTGVWGPTRYAGSYGTNGFYLNFSDNSNTTAATLGKDYSPNGNNWTPNNFSVSAGAGNDSLVDVPTNWGIDTGVGGSVRGNYCTLNPLGTAGAIPTNGNLAVSSSSTVGNRISTILLTTGKWYWEGSGNGYVGAIIGVDGGAFTGSISATGSRSIGYWFDGGLAYWDGGNSGTGTSYNSTDVIGVALDMDIGNVKFYKNNTLIHNLTFGSGTVPNLSTGVYAGYNVGGNTTSVDFNFGQRPFAYTAPSGFRALNTQNLPTPTIGATTATQAGKFFNPVLYTGNGFPTAGTQSISVGFQPDWVWIKARGNVGTHTLTDVVRGVNSQLFTNSTAAQESNADSVTAFNSSGFSLGANTTGLADTNVNNSSYVAWNWKANGAGVTNTAGSITSTVSANTTSGFSIATFTGNGTVGATFGHGLGVSPKMVIVKNRGAVTDWIVGHTSIGWTNFLKLNSTAASASFNVWNNTAPTSTVVTLGNDGAVNGSSMVAYCFAEVPGYSRFGSYTGNGSSTDGPFVFCGFRPRYVLIKRTDVVEGWYLYDTARNTFNALDKFLETNSSAAEATFTFGDYLSNGFKIRNNATGMNGNGGTFIFAAFAEFPFKYSLAR